MPSIYPADVKTIRRDTARQQLRKQVVGRSAAMDTTGVYRREIDGEK